MVAPGVTGNAANCLTAKTGVTVEDAAWSVNGDLATLTFSLSCAKPAALTDLVSFHYRPAAGKTLDQFFQGVFTVDHAAAQVGSESVVTGCALEYPNSTPVELDAITIDTLPDEVTIPSTGHTVTLALSATGRKGEELQPGLTGLTWTLNGQTDGVSVSDSLLLISSDAIPGAFTLTASRDNGDHPLTSAPVTITLKNADPVARQLRILRSGAEAGDHTITGVAGEELSFPYAVRVEDQYGNIMDDQTVVWSLSGAPRGSRSHRMGGSPPHPPCPAGPIPSRSTPAWAPCARRPMSPLSWRHSCTGWSSPAPPPSRSPPATHLPCAIPSPLWTPKATPSPPPPWRRAASPSSGERMSRRRPPA